MWRLDGFLEKNCVVYKKGESVFIVSLTYRCPLEEVDKHLDAHVAYLKQEYDSGIRYYGVCSKYGRGRL